MQSGKQLFRNVSRSCPEEIVKYQRKLETKTYCNMFPARFQPEIAKLLLHAATRDSHLFLLLRLVLAGPALQPVWLQVDQTARIISAGVSSVKEFSSFNSLSAVRVQRLATLAAQGLAAGVRC